MHNLTGKRILVTGATGFIGANLVRALLNENAFVYALVRPNSALWRIRDVLPPIQLCTADLADGAALRRVVDEIAPKIVFHLAVPSGHPSQPAARIEFLQASVLGTANLLEAVSESSLDRFIHLGSSLEYGPHDQPLRESAPLEPLTFRGAAKAAATLLCRQFARSHNSPVIVLRVFSAYGYWESPMRLVPTAILAALGNRPLNLTHPGYRRDLIFAQDVVEACLIAAQTETVPGEIINVGSGQQSANEDIVAMIQQITGQPIQIQAGAHPPSPSDTTHWVADIAKAKAVLGWTARHTLRSGLEETVAWFRRRFPLYLSPQEVGRGE